MAGFSAKYLKKFEVIKKSPEAQTETLTTPEWEAEFPQQWEILSFIKSAETEIAISTAALPIENHTQFSTNSFEDTDLNSDAQGNDRCTMSFDPGQETPGGKSSESMDDGCLDHFRRLISGVTGKNPGETPIGVSLNESDKVEDVTLTSFVYKPKKNGWIAIETTCKNGVCFTKTYPRANKAGSEQEVDEKESLYFDSSSNQKASKVSKGMDGLRYHMTQVAKEVEPNVGTLANTNQTDRDKVVDFNRTRVIAQVQ